MSCEGCGKPAQMQCPQCKKEGVRVPSKFCDQACFKANWPAHKTKVHQASPLNTGRAFLEAKKAEPGVIALKSGMLVKVLEPGKGDVAATAQSPCDVHYRGTLITGEEFDSSYARGEPATFAPYQVIKGWTEALQLMPEGEKWEVYIPYELAYGERGSPPKIPGFSTLVFTIELLKVRGSPKPAAEAAAAFAAAKA